jgi:hypothetical protein
MLDKVPTPDFLYKESIAGREPVYQSVKKFTSLDVKY